MKKRRASAAASLRIDCGTCVLRPYRATDAKIITPLMNDRDVWINLSDRVPHPYLLKHARGFIAMQSKKKPLNLAITVNDIPVGGIGIRPGEDISRVSAEIGYWLGREHWGKGLGTAALIGMTKYVAETFEFSRVFALIFTRNPASARILEKAGYVREGAMKQSVIKDGVIEDEYLYAYYYVRK
jgi:[ribosomal protein S5]-alanine N-acetyltransferase